MRISIDVGGTFTDLVLEDSTAGMRVFKAPTTYPNPSDGVLEAIRRAAQGTGTTTAELLGRTQVLFHSTTRAINAVVTGKTARTAFLASRGHPDSLVIREGGRVDPFNYRTAYPEPYIPRSLTYEVPGRIWADGREVDPLDEDATRAILLDLSESDVEAVAVALLWSIVNPAHELRVGEMIAESLPKIPFTLSHQLNPTIREYRRASSCAIDASLKPIMSDYLSRLQSLLVENGFAGEIFAVTSQGGLVGLEHLADRPILSLNSGPSMAPVAGQLYAGSAGGSIAIITDAGGTTYDVSLVRDGVIPWTRETWVGPVYQGHMTGFPSVDVKSIGAGGGSIASVGADGLLRVGPESAGSVPGPVCYDRGGTKPTVTDAAVVLGYIDPDFFLNGEMSLAVGSAQRAIDDFVAQPLGITIEDGALAILDLATEQMVNAIEDITVKQGIDPQDTLLVAGGGAAGLNAVQIARRLGCARVVVPDVGAVLSAAGAMMSEMVFEFARTAILSSENFEPDKAFSVIEDLQAQAEAFFKRCETVTDAGKIDYSFEGRYPSQVWEIEVPLNRIDFDAEDFVESIIEDFHARHTELFAFRDDYDAVEIMTFRARARCRVSGTDKLRLWSAGKTSKTNTDRPMVFHGTGPLEARAIQFDALSVDEVVSGPAVIESSFTTIVLPPGASAGFNPRGFVEIEPGSPRQAVEYGMAS